MSGRLSVNRTYRFEAAHRLYAKSLTPAENDRIYGKCAREGGHGHNYEVTVRIQASRLARDEMDRRVKAALLDRVDHRNLDDVLPESVTTGETLARVFFEWLEPEFRDDAPLRHVAVRETRSNLFEYAPSED